MANLAGFVIGSALASDLGGAERMRMGLVGSLMPSPLAGALIVEALVESEQEDGGGKDDDGNGDDGELAVRKGDDGRGVGSVAVREVSDAGASVVGRRQLRREQGEIEAKEQELYDLAERADRRGGELTTQEWDWAMRQLDWLKLHEERVADERARLLESVLSPRKPSDSSGDETS